MVAELDLDSVLKIAEIATIIGSVAIALITFGKTSSRLESNLQVQSADIQDLKTDIKKLNEVMTAVAVQSQRMDMIAERLNQLDRRWDELRHGHGYVTGGS